MGCFATKPHENTKTVAYQYDLTGNVTRTTDQNGTLIDQGFDDVNRLIGRDSRAKGPGEAEGRPTTIRSPGITLPNKCQKSAECKDVCTDLCTRAVAKLNQNGGDSTDTITRTWVLIKTEYRCSAASK